jgi:hypothetical protein
MVYEKKCDECGTVLDFGGRDISGDPENGIRFDDRLLCRECVKRFVEFGTGDLDGRIERIEGVVRELGYQVGVDVDDLNLERSSD